MPLMETGYFLDKADITKRQMWHWVDKGYLVPKEPNPGTGHPLTWDSSELLIAKTMKRLIHVGFTVSAAADYARMLVENGESFADLGEKCLLMIEMET